MSSVVDSKTTLVALQGLRSAGNDAARATERLATGLKVNRAGDDPAGLAKATALKAEIASYGQVKKNIGSALSQLGDVTSGVSTILDYLTEMRTLAVASAGEADSAVRTNYQSQFAELIVGIGEVVAATKFGGTSVLSGGNATSVQIGINSTASSKTLTFSDASASTLGVSALTVGAVADASTAIGTIDTAIDTLGGHLAKYGGYQRSLESLLDMADASILSKSSHYGDIMNADLAVEATNLAAAKIRQDSATAVLAQANSMNRNIADYLLNGALG
jgi:flagellin